MHEDTRVETIGTGSSRRSVLPGRLKSVEIAGPLVRNVPVRVEADEYRGARPEVVFLLANYPLIPPLPTLAPFLLGNLSTRRDDGIVGGT